jgi:hypothetical protein
MKTIVTLFLLCVAQTIDASELKVKFQNGWGTDYSLQFDFDKGEITYQPDKKDTDEKPAELQRRKLINSKNVGLYVKALVTRIKADDPGGIFGDDAPTYHIIFTDRDFHKEFTMGFISPPSAIFLNEGYSAEKELETAKAFTKAIDSYFLCNLIDMIVGDIAPKK